MDKDCSLVASRVAKKWNLILKENLNCYIAKHYLFTCLVFIFDIQVSCSKHC